MQFAVLLSNSIIANFLLMFCIIHKSKTTPCDTTWIRLVYMLSCGKKKRESVPIRNESFTEPLPMDIHGAIHYFRERDPNNPLFNEDINVLEEILDENERQIQREKEKYILYRKGFLPRHPKKFTTKNGSALMKKILYSVGQKNYLGIPGFPDQWDIHELIDQKENENYRREIDRLLEECCKTAQESSCNGDTFLGACK